MNKIFFSTLLFTFIIIGVIYSAPDTSPRFVDNGDYTISDQRTGRMWQKCNYGQETSGGVCGVTNTGTRTWTEALAYCEGLTLGSANYTDWRLPDYNELFSIVDLTRTTGHAINETFFSPGAMDSYWTSTTDPGAPGTAKEVNFAVNASSTTSSKSTSRHVRCVRGP